MTISGCWPLWVLPWLVMALALLFRMVRSWYKEILENW